jgi:hypothetical protein
MTDVPFGVLLSGGLDSSLVAAVASRHLANSKAANVWGAQLHTFSVGLKVLLVAPGTLVHSLEQKLQLLLLLLLLYLSARNF